jgi:tripartite-type tricarboxylate transporter receptor subunit TctC
MLSFVLCAVACTWVTAAVAQGTYPNRPIRMLVGYPVGGGADLVGRTLAARLSETMAQPVVVENRPGTSGNLSAEVAATLPADGYTILVLTGSHAISQSLYTSLRYNLERDFTPVAYVGRFSLVVLVNPTAKLPTLKALLAQAKEQPGSIRYSTSGNGAAEHLAGAMLEQMTGAPLTHVPYKGGSEAMAAVVGGHVEASISTLQAASSFIKGGQLVPLAVTASARTRQLPDVPTVAEAGVSGYELYSLYGVAVRAGTPKEIVTRLNAEVNKALQHPETVKAFERVTVEPTGGTPEQFAAVIKTDVARFAQAAKAANLKLD